MVVTLNKTTLMFFTVLVTRMLNNFPWNIFQVAKPTMKAIADIRLKLDVIAAYFKLKLLTVILQCSPS